MVDAVTEGWGTVKGDFDTVYGRNGLDGAVRRTIETGLHRVTLPIPKAR